VLTVEDRARLAVRQVLEADPGAALEDCGRAALATGASLEVVTAILSEYVQPDAPTAPCVAPDRRQP